MKRALVLLLALVFALMVTLPVSAAPPVIETDGNFVLDKEMKGLCRNYPDMVLYLHEVGVSRTTTQYDKADNPLRIQMHVSGTDVWSSSAGSGRVLSGRFSSTLTTDAVSKVTTARGLFTGITVPGYGTVMMMAGRWVDFRDDTMPTAGKFSLFDPDQKDVQQFCSFLAN